MDIIISDSESKLFIMADTSGGIIYIMKNKHWGDMVRSKPTYEDGGPTSKPVDEFMIEALSWESLLHALYEADDHPSKLAHFFLDLCVCSKKRYYDIFADLFQT